MEENSRAFVSAQQIPSTMTAAAALAQAVALHRAGRLTDAETMYRQILAAQPRHFDGLHLLGVIFMQRGDAAAAALQIDAALEVEPRHVLALVKPVWLFNRYNTCWRWLLDRDDSPWYPTARLFRQDETRDWNPVIARVASALRHYVPRPLPVGKATRP